MTGSTEGMPSGEGVPSGDGMPSGGRAVGVRLRGPAWLTRGGVVRGVAVAVITATITLAAACSDEDTVDTIPPPWPVRTTQPDGPAGPPRQIETSTVTEVPTPFTTRTARQTSPRRTTSAGTTTP